MRRCRSVRATRGPVHGDRGSATAEIAVALPALVLVTLAALWGVSVAAAQLACVDAVRAGARAAARGEPLAEVRSAVARSAPRDALVSVRRDRRLTRVDVQVTMRPPFPGGLGGSVTGLTLREHALAVTEPGAG